MLKVITDTLDNLLTKDEVIYFNENGINLRLFKHDFNYAHFLSNNDKKYLLPRKKDDSVLNDDIKYNIDINLVYIEKGEIIHKIILKPGVINKVWHLNLLFHREYGEYDIGVYDWLKSLNITPPIYFYNFIEAHRIDYRSVGVGEIIEYHIKRHKFKSMTLSTFVKYCHELGPYVDGDLTLKIDTITDLNCIKTLTPDMFSKVKKITINGKKKFTSDNVNEYLKYLYDLDIDRITVAYGMISDLSVISNIEDEKILNFVSKAGDKINISEETLFAYAKTCKNYVVFCNLTNLVLSGKSIHVLDVKLKALHESGYNMDNYFNKNYKLLTDSQLIIINKLCTDYLESKDVRLFYILHKRFGRILNLYRTHDSKIMQYIESFERTDEYFDDIYDLASGYIFSDTSSGMYMYDFTKISQLLDVIRHIIIKDDYNKIDLLNQMFSRVMEFLSVKQGSFIITVDHVAKIADRYLAPLLCNLEQDLVTKLSEMCNDSSRLKLMAALLG